MQAEPGLVLGDVFAPCVALAVTSRLELATLLAVPGRPPAILPADLAALPMHPDSGTEVRRAIVSGLGERSIEILSGLRLREVVPAMTAAAGDLCLVSAPVRLQGLIERNGAATWEALGELTLAQIMVWSGVGPRTAIDLIGEVVGAVVARADLGLSPTAADQPAARKPALADLATLLGYERDGALRAAIADLTDEQHPEEVRAAAGRLFGALGNGDNACLTHLDDLLLAAGDERDRAVFEHRMLSLGGPVTLAQLAMALGVGSERVRQLRDRAVDRVARAFEQGPGRLRTLVAATSEHFAEGVPVESVVEHLAAQKLPPVPDSRSLLLLWLAGPYGVVDDHPGWLAKDPAALVAETRQLLAEDGGVRPLAHVTKELERLGLAPEHCTRWLAEQPARIVDDLVVSTIGSLADVAERILSAVGRALSVPELCAWTAPAGAPGDASGLRAHLHRDPRFVWVGDAGFELAEWAGATEGESDGRTGPEPGARAGPAADGRLWLRIEIDDDVLGGSAAPVPLPFVEALGVRTGSRRTFPTRYGPVAVSNDGVRPMRGSARPVALAVGAATGDALVLDFRPSQDEAVVTFVPLARSEATAGGT